MVDVGRLGTVGVWGHLNSLTARDLPGYVRRVEDLGYGTLWVPEVVEREPFSLLATTAACTGRIMLGTSIASIWARDAVSMRMAALTLQELSSGRFILGLGVSHHHLSEKVRGHRYEKPLTRMREYLDRYRAAPYRGPAWEPAPEPPIVLAALRRGMVELAASRTDGVFPYLVTADRVRWMRSLIDAAAPVAGSAARPVLVVTLPVVLEQDASAARAVARSYLTPYLRTPNYRASWAEQGFDESDWESPGSDRLVDAMTASGDAGNLAERVRVLHDAGADHVALIPLGPGPTTEHLPALEALARPLGLA